MNIINVSKCLFWFVFFGLMVANIYVFGQGVHLSDEIHYFEEEIQKLQSQNVELEQRVLKVDSLQYAASISAELDFVKKAQPLYLGNPEYASRD